MPGREQMMTRQRVLADFGEFALRGEDLDAVLREACRLVNEALGTERAQVLEIQDGGRELLVRARAGAKSEAAGNARLPLTDESPSWPSIRDGAITRTQRRDGRSEAADPASAVPGVSLAHAPIFLPGSRLYGLLQIEAATPRDFTDEDTQFLRTYTTILGPVIDRLLKVRVLNEAEKRFRLIVESARDYAIYLADADDRITDWLPGAEAVFGWTAEEAQGQSSSILFTPEDRDEGEDEKEAETARREGSAPNVRWHLRKGGKRIFIEGAVTALHDENGQVRGLLKIGQDVTERRKREEDLRASEERFRQFGSASSDLLWIREAHTMQLEYLSPAFEPIYGVSLDAMLANNTFSQWAALVHPDDRERTLGNLDRVRGGERVRHEFRIIRPADGETRWIENTDFPLVGETGDVQRIAGIAKDVTEERASAARMEVLVAELQHRSRNLLGVIAAVASRTLGQGGSAADFEERLKALSRAQGLLSQSGSATVEVGALVRAELAAHATAGTAQVKVSGPKVSLTARQVQNFALAVHELTTNAVKYGALRQAAGWLSVTWATSRDARGRKRLVLNWVERGIDVQPDKVTRRGYGRELIERALSYALSAETHYVLGQDGVRCRIELPLA